METLDPNESILSPEKSIDQSSTSKPVVQVSTPEFKNPASPYTALKSSLQEGVGSSPEKIKFFGPRFMTIWVMPIALTGIVMEFLFVSPLRNSNPFS